MPYFSAPFGPNWFKSEKRLPVIFMLLHFYFLIKALGDRFLNILILGSDGVGDVPGIEFFLYYNFKNESIG